MLEPEQNPEFVADVVQFLAQNRKWWLSVVVVRALVGAGLIFGETSAALFIYSSLLAAAV